MKQLAKSIIRQFVFHAPWGVREALLDSCIDRIGALEIAPRILQKLNITEVGATGDLGVITSAWNDACIFPEYARTGSFSHTLTLALTNFFGDGGGTYMDIGANIGLTTIPIARIPQVHCLAFEPEPQNFECLKQNVTRNAPGGTVAFHQIALFHSRTRMSLAIAEGNLGDHRLTQGSIPGRRKIEIEALPLDDFLDQVQGRLAVKIDTQGAEPFVISGGQKVLSRAAMLAIEFCPYLMKQLGGEPAVVIDLISGFDRVAVMSGGKTETPHFITPAEATSLLQQKLMTAADSDSDYLDILAVRGG